MHLSKKVLILLQNTKYLQIKEQHILLLSRKKINLVNLLKKCKKKLLKAISFKKLQINFWHKCSVVIQDLQA
jgi:hypothetical protein